jgi:hypothetical protein
MRRNSILTTVQKSGGNITFSGILPYAVSTLLVILLSSRLYEPQYHPYLFRIILSVTMLTLISGLGGIMIVRFLPRDLPGRYLPPRRFLRILGYTLGATWAAYHWEKILLYFEGIKTGCLDSILGKDIAFYLFELPFYESLFAALFCLVTVSLASLFVGLLVQNDTVYRHEMNCRRGLCQNRYDWIYIQIGVLLFLLAWGICLERYDQLYWQMDLNFNIDYANGPVLLPSFGPVFVMVITGSFFVIFPFLRGRRAIGYALQKLSANRHSQANPHFRLIRYVLATAMFVLWHTAPQTSQPPILQASGIRLHSPFSKAVKFSPQEWQGLYTDITGVPWSISQWVSGNDSDALNIARPPVVEQGN